MGFKLVRVDAIEPFKVSLPLGSHSIGRGKLLDCNDSRVSRNHAELVVSSDSILLKALHKNPCFVKKKSLTEIIIFSEPDQQALYNGDQFSLIPDSFWYEVIHCTEDLPTEPTETNTMTNVNNNENQINQENTNGDRNSNTEYYNHDEEENILNCSESLLDAMVNSPFGLQQENVTSLAQGTGKGMEKCTDSKENNAITEQLVDSTNQHDESTNQHDESTNQHDKSTNQPTISTNQPTESARSLTPTKRMHSEESSPCDVKRVKTEPEEPPVKNSNDDDKTQPYTPQATALTHPIKTEPGSPQDSKPGPSNVQGGRSSDGAGNPSAMLQSPTKPPNKQMRERCMYGANCYRRNPQHKAQFSHPSDTDWGAGPRGVCPWGASCQRTDPRHWRDHEHPPGALPHLHRPRGNRPGMQLVRRHGNNFYINANSVHFYDDHFQVEDSDGDSVDYDYEF